jgi:hypothetical protein
MNNEQRLASEEFDQRVHAVLATTWLSWQCAQDRCKGAHTNTHTHTHTPIGRDVSHGTTAGCGA